MTIYKYYPAVNDPRYPKGKRMRTTDIRDGFNLARKADKDQPYKLELDTYSPAQFFMGFEGGGLDDGANIYNEYKRKSQNGDFQSSCGQISAYLKDEILKNPAGISNWEDIVDNQRGKTGIARTLNECEKHLIKHISEPKFEGYLYVTLGCHSFILAIVENRVRVYQAYMAAGITGYNFTNCIEWQKNMKEEFSVHEFCRDIRSIFRNGKSHEAFKLFHGTCYPSSSAINNFSASYILKRRRGGDISVDLIKNNFIKLGNSHAGEWKFAHKHTFRQYMNIIYSLPSGAAYPSERVTPQVHHPGISDWGLPAAATVAPTPQLPPTRAAWGTPRAAHPRVHRGDPRWAPNAPVCLCGKRYGNGLFGNLRHHCRRCGILICSDCGVKAHLPRERGLHWQCKQKIRCRVA